LSDSKPPADDRSELLADAAAYARFLADASSGVGVPMEWTAAPRPSAPAPTASVPAAPPAAPAAPQDDSALQAIRAELGECTRCRLHATRKNVVFGQGHPQARVMFVGEAPGADEDEQGLAFVGRAGQLLTDIIEKGMRMSRSDVYIANILKSRPPGNRNPEPDEVLACAPFLDKQIAAIQPKVLIGLGKFAAHWLLKTQEPITKLRGRVGSYNGIPVMPTYHPAYLLRNPTAKKEVWEDVKTVLQMLEQG
jgi:uracil-DNA glycosylase family 4